MEFKPSYLTIPFSLHIDTRLDRIDALVYGIIHWFTHLKNGNCTATNQTIAEILNVSYSGVSHSISRLNKYGYVQVILDENNQRINIIPLISLDGFREGGVDLQSKGGCSTEQPHIKENNINNKEKENSIKEKELKTSKNSLTPCTQLELWEIHKIVGIRLWDVFHKHREMLELIQSGGWKKKYGKTLYFSLINWLRMGIKDKRYERWSELDQLEIGFNDPRRNPQAEMWVSYWNRLKELKLI